MKVECHLFPDVLAIPNEADVSLFVLPCVRRYLF